MAKSFPFPRSHRLTHARQYEAVYDARVRASREAMTIFGIRNDLGHARLGLSVPRKVGTAPRRNRVKRLLREAFRLLQQHWPRGYDIVVNVRPHEVITLEQYQELLGALVMKIHRQWEERENAEVKDQEQARKQQGGFRPS